MKKVTRKKQMRGLPGPTGSDLPKIGQPATQALAGIGVQRLEQLTSFSEKEILRIHGMGPKALGILRQALADRGLAFKKENER
jgi:hypothetical protein